MRSRARPQGHQCARGREIHSPRRLAFAIVSGMRDEPSFADLAPVYESFPGFVARDFAAFRREKQRDAEANPERLLVKRKLAALGKALAPALAAPGLDLAVKTSLSHPYTYNGFKVDSMWVYFGRGEAAKKAVKKRLGGELGKDVDPTYQGVILLVEIDERRVACGLKIHPAAWWDAQNLARRVKAEGGAPEALTAILNALPRGYALSIGDWKKRYEAGELYPADIRNYFQYWKPGEQWLNLLHETEKDAAIARGPALAEDLAPRLAALAPAWRFAAWAPENDFVLRKSE
jgi:hypothetical protein